MTSTLTARRIAATNDRHRSMLGVGCMYIRTQRVAMMTEDAQNELRNSIEGFKFGTEDQVAAGKANSVDGGGNDPYGEHDFGSFDQDGETYFWKLDDYGTDYREHGTTHRMVMTVMHASDY